MPVLISGSRHTPPQPFLIGKQMEDFLLTYQRMESEGEHPVGIAAYLHDELVRIHPFIDGNGRTSRLLMNLYLLRQGYVIVNLKGDAVSRLAYYKTLEASHMDGRREDFAAFVAKAEKEALENYLDLMGTDYATNRD